MNVIFFASAFSVGSIDRTAAGQLGDFVGGYVGTGLALLSVLLLLATLKAQRLSAEREHFEAKYFEMLKLHRENISEIDLQGASGRKLFVLLLREWRALHGIARDVAASYDPPLTQEQLIQAAYYGLFYGTGPNSSRMLLTSLAELPRRFVVAFELSIGAATTKADIQETLSLGYRPFEGHQSRLGHYYRHLFQSVRFVDRQTLSIDKYEFVKTIRAQLSTHEQALLLLNSLTPLGRNWWAHDLMVKYRLVQNLPREFFDSETELDLERMFSRRYFEWDDVVLLASPVVIVTRPRAE